MLANKAELGINLASLKRHDPYISEIVDCSTHVALYRYKINDQASEWEKTEVEGALFVYRRMAPLFYGFTILNRLNMENLSEPLTSDLEFQTQNPFLLYKNSRGLIYGIWFFDDDHCTRIGSLLTRLCNETAPKNKENNMNGSMNLIKLPRSIQSKNVSPPLSGPATTAQPSNNFNEMHQKNSHQDKGNNGVDIMQLLSKARDKFEKTQGYSNEPNNSQASHSLNGARKLSYGDPQANTKPRKVDVASLFNKRKNEPVENTLPPPVSKPDQLSLALPIKSHSPLMVSPFPKLHTPTESKLSTSVPLSLSMNKLIAPEEFERSATSTPKKANERAPSVDAPLTENELKSSLIKLIETDSEFVSKIHQLYLAKFK